MGAPVAAVLNAWRSRSQRAMMAMHGQDGDDSEDVRRFTPRSAAPAGPGWCPSFIARGSCTWAPTGALPPERRERQDWPLDFGQRRTAGARRYASCRELARHLSGRGPMKPGGRGSFACAKGLDFNPGGLAMGGCDADAGDDDDEDDDGDADFSFTPLSAASRGARTACAPTDAGAVAWTATCSPPRRQAPARVGSALGLIRILPSRASF